MRLEDIASKCDKHTYSYVHIHTKAHTHTHTHMAGAQQLQIPLTWIVWQVMQISCVRSEGRHTYVHTSVHACTYTPVQSCVYLLQITNYTYICTYIYMLTRLSRAMHTGLSMRKPQMFMHFIHSVPSCIMQISMRKTQVYIHAYFASMHACMDSYARPFLSRKYTRDNQTFVCVYSTHVCAYTSLVC